MNKRGKEEDSDGAEPSPFQGIQKSNVLREARIFNDQQINVSKCIEVLAKILYLITKGESFSKDESTELFFACTKLFQSSDAYLRRMVYLVIKEINVESDESLIVIACLSKDITSKTDLFRGNSIRVLTKLMDPSMVGQIERFLKQSVVDKNPFIVGSTLVSAQHLLKTNADIIKRWSNEIAESLNNPSRMVQYHGLALTYHTKKHDKLAISKVMTSLARSPPKSPYAQMLQVRITTNLLRGGPLNPDLFKFLSDSLQNRNFMVMYEAARSICSLDNVNQAQVAPAIEVLHQFLGSNIPAQRFAAVRTLSEAVVRFPTLVAPCISDLEGLLNDSNRSIATLAITTLLKTGQESNVDRHMKSISGFMSEISDDFKIVIVDAIKALCFKFPHKHQTLMSFLLASLREEGGFKYKKAIVTSMLDIILSVKESKEYGLDLFCEFIEDCEFPELSIRILNVLGEKGPQTSNPAKYIRFLFNRVILEIASVRSAAVTSLAKFGAAVPALTQNVMVLLKRCLNDNDDEVRDRAVLYISLLQSKPKLATVLLTEEKVVETGMLCDLENSLQRYLDTPSAVQQQPFTLAQHMVATQRDAESKDDAGKDRRAGGGGAGAGGAAGSDASRSGGVDLNPYMDLLNSVPEIQKLGKLWKSCSPVELTEQETEYVVNCIKHIYPQHVVFQFNITNNLKDEVLEDVTVDMEPSSEDWVEVTKVAEKKVESGVGGVSFVIFERGAAFVSGSISCTLKFKIDGTEDEYQLEEVEVAESDYMRRGEAIGLVEFKRQWEMLGETTEVVKKYTLGLDKLQAAVDAVVELLGMKACDETAKAADSARTHSICMHGTFFGGVPVLCRALFMIANGVTLKIAIRSKDSSLSQMLTLAIR